MRLMLPPTLKSASVDFRPFCLHAWLCTVRIRCYCSHEHWSFLTFDSRSGKGLGYGVTWGKLCSFSDGFPQRSPSTVICIFDPDVVVELEVSEFGISSLAGEYNLEFGEIFECFWGSDAWFNICSNLRIHTHWLVSTTYLTESPDNQGKPICINSVFFIFFFIVDLSLWTPVYLEHEVDCLQNMAVISYFSKPALFLCTMLWLCWH